MTDFQIGEVVTITRTLTQRDFDRFAALSGDDNPIHVDPVFSARTKFGKTVAHGMMLYSTVCGALGTRLPGPGMVQLDQALMFPNATPVEETITVRLEVMEVRPDTGLIVIDTKTLRADGAVGLQGETIVRADGAGGWHDAPPFEASPRGDGEDTPFKGFSVGQRAETIRTFSAADLSEYADLTGDINPLYSDSAFAKAQGYRDALIPGGLIGGMFSALLGTTLPGRGTNYLKQRFHFTAPAYPGEALTARVEVWRLRAEKQLINLLTTCHNPAGEIVCQGEALVQVSDVGG